MGLTARQIPLAAVGGVYLGSVDFTPMLDSGESLTGTPTVTEVTTTDLTISNAAVSAASLTINGATVAAGGAVQFKMIGQVAGTTYRLKVTCSTDSAPAQTLVMWIKVTAVDE